MTVNQRIKGLREENRYTIKEIAEKLKVSVATAQRYESDNGIKAIPYDIIEEYARIFDVSPSYIMGWVDRRNHHSFNEVTAKNVNLTGVSSDDGEKHTFISPTLYHQGEYDELTKELLDALNALKPRDRVRVIDAILTLLNYKDNS